MSHIHSGEGEHDLTVSFFIVRVDGPEPRLVLHRHKRFGLLMMHGGHVELTETPWDATVRELAEETGYTPAELRIMQPHLLPELSESVMHPIPLSVSTGRYPSEVAHSHTDIAYVFVASGAASASPQDGETQDSLLVTLSELAALPDDEVLAYTREVGSFALAVTDNGRWFAIPATQFMTGSVHRTPEPSPANKR